VVWGRSLQLLSIEFDPHPGLHHSAVVAKLVDATALGAGGCLSLGEHPCGFEPRLPHHTTETVYA
jgi:hypothetical protein